MLPKYHMILGAIASILIYLIFHITLFQTIIIFLASLLIDFDHYLFYFLKTGELSLKKAKKYFLNNKKKFLSISPEKRETYKRSILIFHGIEFWLLLVFLSFFNKIFLFIFMGVMLHISLDFIEMIYQREPLYAKLSPVYVYLTNKKKLISCYSDFS